MVNVGDVKVDVSKLTITREREAPQDSHSLRRWKRLSLRHYSSQTTLVASDAYRGWGILTVRIRYHSLRELLSSKHTRHRFGESRKLGIETFAFTPQQLLVRRAILNIDAFPSIFARLETSCLVYPFKLGQQLSWKSTEFQKETESYRGIFLRLENHIESHVWNPGACGEWQCARSCQT